MFLENIEIVKQAFNECKGNGMYFALFFVALIYIFIKEENKNIKIFLGYFSVGVLIIVLNPIFNKLVHGFINEKVYWRMFWILPMGIAMSYVAVKLIQDRKSSKEKIALFIAICLMIMASGKLVYNKDNFIKVDNWYKIPDEAELIAEAISKDDEKYKEVLLPENLVPYIRQIDANINLAYGRESVSYDEYEILIHLRDGNVEYVTNECKKYGWNYLIFKRETVLSISPEYFDFKLFAQTENYDIYKLVDI